MWAVIPSLLKRGSVTLVVSVLLVTFLFQYLPKIYHSIRHLRRNATLSGYIFGTVWWGIALNMIAYFVAAHVSLFINFIAHIEISIIEIYIISTYFETSCELIVYVDYEIKSKSIDLCFQCYTFFFFFTWVI